MKIRTFSYIGLTALLLLAFAALALAQPVSRGRADEGEDLQRLPDLQPTLVQPVRQGQADEGALVDIVRQATQDFKTVEAAEAAGYGLFLGCVSGPQGGAMGVHFPNDTLVRDGVLDPMQPEVLVYEPKGGNLELVAVEYLVLADDWHANNEGQPVLMGQVFNYVGSPNRYGMPAFYELHVWALKNNPAGMFADWNPKVSCEKYAG